VCCSCTKGTRTPILFFGEYDEYDAMTELKLLRPKDAPLLPAVIACLPLKPREAMFSKSSKHRIEKASMERSNSREAKPQKREPAQRTSRIVINAIAGPSFFTS